MEISAHEFRIGNYILLDNPKHRPNDTEEIHKVCGITENTLRLIRESNNPYEDSYGQFLEYLKPIPLTEELLLRFGFEKVDGDFFMNDYIASFNADGTLWLGKEGCCQQDTIKDGIKYAHQLQNLIFALCGEELKLN